MKLFQEINLIVESKLDESRENVSFFSMADVSKVEKMKLDAAKKLAHDKIVDKTNAKKENIRKAKAMVDKAKNVTNLMMGMSNFILSSEGKKVIK